MNRFNCPCGAEVFFESRVCESCKRALAFNPDTLSFELLPPENAPTEPSAIARIYAKTASTTAYATG